MGPTQTPVCADHSETVVTPQAGILHFLGKLFAFAVPVLVERIHDGVVNSGTRHGIVHTPEDEPGVKPTELLGKAFSGGIIKRLHTPSPPPYHRLHTPTTTNTAGPASRMGVY